MLDKTARFVVVALLSLLVAACGSKDEKQKPAPKKEEPAKLKTAGQPKAAQPAPGMVAKPAAGDTAAPAAAEEPSGLVPELTKLADKACACKDKACTGEVQNAVATLMSQAQKPPASETQAIGQAMQKLQGCVAAVQKK